MTETSNHFIANFALQSKIQLLDEVEFFETIENLQLRQCISKEVNELLISSTNCNCHVTLYANSEYLFVMSAFNRFYNKKRLSPTNSTTEATLKSSNAIHNYFSQCSPSLEIRYLQNLIVH